MDTLLAIAILGFLVGLGFYMWDDLRELARELLAEDEQAREWFVARSRPYDRERDAA